MKKAKRVFLIVLDSVGIGEMPDAEKFGDKGSNTLKAISSSPLFDCKNLKKLGLFNIDSVDIEKSEENPLGSFARMQEQSQGKDTTVGHWEIAGLISSSPLPTFPNGFSKEIIEEFEKQTGKKVLCNKPYSGTEVIKDYGAKHIQSGDLIVYTSADSVFQIAAHEDIVPIEKLYEYCAIARKILTGKNGVGRVIARPFKGEYPFERTPNRHDFSLEPTGTTMLDILKDNGLDVISIGKINDIFAGRGITKSIYTKSNADGIDKTIEIAKTDFNGLCFVNLVDFDSKYGHRNDIDGYASALSYFDKELPNITAELKEDDVLIITADHGCDPSMPSTDQSREYTPMLIYGKGIMSGINLGTRSTFADIGATVLEILGQNSNEIQGESFYNNIKKD